MRSHVLAGSPGGPHSGTIVLLREGIAAWIERGIAGERAPVQSTSPPVPRLLMSEQLHTEVVHVLADIALKSIERR
jgi:hypothetical protein